MTDSQRTISLLGDIVIRSRLAQMRREDNRAFREALTELERSDLVLANLEIPLSRRGYRIPKWANMRADPEVIEDIKTLGIDAVTLANNHMMDYGPDAMLDTLATCDGAGIARCGAGADLDAALEPLRFEIGGATVGLVNASCTLPMESDAGEGKAGIAPIHIVSSYEIDASLSLEQPGTMPIVHTWARKDDQDRVCERVARLAAEVDVVIAAIHWGVPSPWLSPDQGRLAEYQQPLGHALVEAGADVVWGHHAHELHPIEVYRDKLILYSVGHFLLENPWAFMGPESVIAQLVLQGTGVAGLELVPVWIDDRGLPGRAHGKESDHVLGKLRDLSQPFGVEVVIEDEWGRVALA
jgi:poly-gamma-glutamate capsule biosynthesis protein CapA/YwtB (metallophosphatase superfamily)